LKNILGHLYTLVSVALLWVFFRLGTRESLYFLKKLLTLNHGNEGAVLFVKSGIDVQFIISFIAAIVFAFPWWRKLKTTDNQNLNPLRYGALIMLLILSICSLASNAYNPFIYFRF
jgi:alginate O-acetyltransferase complex protein AlgI